MRPGDLWEVTVGRFTVSGSGEESRLKMSGKKPMSRQDLRDLYSAISEARLYSIQYEHDGEWP